MALRIRVVSHPPLPPLRAWIPIPSSTSTIRELANELAKTLPGLAFDLELEGFALMLDSPCSMLDSAKDIIDLKLSTQDAPPPAKRARLSPAPLPPATSVYAPSLIPAVAPAPVPAPQKAKIVDSSSSDDSSDSSDSSSDEEGPQVITTIKAKVAAPPSPSDSSSSSDSSSEDEVKKPVIPVARVAPASVAARPAVAPGEGMKRTKTRNARARAKAALASTSVASGSSQSPAPLARPAWATAAQLAATIARSLPTTPAPASSDMPRSLPATPALPARKIGPIDPYMDFTVGKNKRKQVDPPSASTLKAPTRTKFGADGVAAVVSAPLPVVEQPLWTPVSPKYYPPSPPHYISDLPAVHLPPAASVPLPPSPVVASTKSKKQLKYEKDQARYLPAPSARTDLPPNVTVTRVDVESPSWEAGVGKVIEGTSRDYVAPARVEVMQVDEGMQDAEGGDEWARWPTAEEIEETWEEMSVLPQSSNTRGKRVATKVLELHPQTFAPTLSIKYGTLLPLRGSTDTLRIRLHPSCYFVEEYVEEEEDWTTDGCLRLRHRFGQDAVEMEGTDELDVYAGDWGEVRSLD